MAMKSNDQHIPSGAKAVSVSFPFLDLAACCLLKLNKGSEIDSLFGKRNEGEEDSGCQYYLGLAFAQQGQFEEAVRCLNHASHIPSYKEPAQKSLLEALRRQIGIKLHQRDWDGASEALSQASLIDPANVEFQRMISALGNHLPRTYLRTNQRARAAAAWEEMQKKDPRDGKVAHCLALLYFWEAQELEEQGRGDEAKSIWEGAIRNWVALFHSETFWRQWREDREKICGKVPDAVIKDLPKQLLERYLARRIADYQNEYLNQKRDGDARRMGLLSLELATEIETAEVLQKVNESLDRQEREEKMPQICGLMMLEHLGELERAQKLLAVIEVTRTNETFTKHLHWCLSPWALPWVMVQERQYVEAIENIKQKLNQNPSSSDGNDLMAIAYLEHGKALRDIGSVLEALDKWKLGLGYVRSRKETGDEIRREVEKSSIREAVRLQRDGSREGLDNAIQLIEKARGMTDTQRMKENLSELYTSKGVMEGNDTSQTETTRRDKAKRYLEKALSLDVNNGRAKQNLAILLTGDAVVPFKKEHYSEAISLLRRAYQLAPSEKDAYTTLSLALSNYGVVRWNQGDYFEGRRLVLEALEIDPSNEHARRNLSSMSFM
jgi:tetratricopeptide (TPR) repeat protein